MQQNVMKCRCLVLEMLRIADAETTECYEMIYRLILAPMFRNILLHSMN